MSGQQNGYSEPVNWSWVNRFRSRYPDTGFETVREGNETIFIKHYLDWTPADLQRVPEYTLRELMIVAAGEHYSSLREIKPRAFQTTEDFAAAILNEWEHNRGYRIAPEFRPGYFNRSNGGANVRPQSLDTTAPKESTDLRLVIPELTRDAKPSDSNEITSPDPKARAEEAVKSIKASVRAA